MAYTEAEFRGSVARGIDALPERVLRHLSNVAVVIEDRVSEERREELGLADTEDLLGLYEGVPQTKRGSGYSALPDKITIFREPIEARAQTSGEVERLVAETVWHEVAHHFGMEEDEVREEESRRGFVL